MCGTQPVVRPLRALSRGAGLKKRYLQFTIYDIIMMIALLLGPPTPRVKIVKSKEITRVKGPRTAVIRSEKLERSTQLR